MSQRSVGTIGLGVMGEPICRNLARKSGWRVACHDRDPEPMERLRGHGAQPLADPAELVRTCDVVMLSLPSGSAVQELLAVLVPHARDGQLFIDLGTSGVDVARAAHAQLATRGARFIDAPVARTRQAAESGTLAVMVGGDPALLEEARPLLDCIATDITHCGPVGAGQLTKILNNLVMFETGLALAEARALALKAGFDPVVIFDALTKGSGDSFALRNHGRKAMLPGAFPERAFSVRYARKDLSYALAMARDLGVAMAGAQAVDDSFDRAIRQGLGELYWPVISRLVDGTGNDGKPP
jgi:3-hydroxyisobutyrate dehydrogenase-like beta-hydroxyacid dehydrogenase